MFILGVPKLYIFFIFFHWAQSELIHYARIKEIYLIKKERKIEENRVLIDSFH